MQRRRKNRRERWKMEKDGYRRRKDRGEGMQRRRKDRDEGRIEKKDE